MVSLAALVCKVLLKSLSRLLIRLGAVVGPLVLVCRLVRALALVTLGIVSVGPRLVSRLPLVALHGPHVIVAPLLGSITQDLVSLANILKSLLGAYFLG